MSDLHVGALCRCLRCDHDGSTTHRAVFNVLLVVDAEINDDLDALLEELGDAGGEANDGSGEGEGDDDDLEAFLAEQLDES